MRLCKYITLPSPFLTTNDLVFLHALDDEEDDKDNGNGDDDIRGGPHLHDCPLCKQSVKSADHKHSSL